MMKRLLSLFAFLAITMGGYAQNIDNFEVGPYEVDYKGPGDYKSRLRKDVDLYEYYGLKRDTIVEAPEIPSHPVYRTWQLGMQYGLHGYGLAGSMSTISVSGNYKLRIGSQLFFSAGASVGLGIGDYGLLWDNLNETMLEAGVPLALELADINRERASLYAMVGITPTFFTSMGNSTDSGIDAYDGYEFEKSGFFVAPVVGIGAYVPALGHLVRVGAFWQHDILFKDFDENVYARRIGRSVLGVEIGVAF